MITSATRTRATKAPAPAPKKAIITPEVIERAKAKRENIDHSVCTHPRNPKGRAMCRAARREAAAPAACSKVIEFLPRQ